MKITAIRTHLARCSIGEDVFYSSQAAFPERKSLLVEIETDADLTGWGECGQYGPAEPVEALIHKVFEPMLLGQDPRRTSAHWHQMYCRTRDFGRKGHTIEGISGIDIALWDIHAQSHGCPVSALLGGQFRDRVATYATGLYYKGNAPHNPQTVLKQSIEEAQRLADQGFPAIKMKIGLLDIAHDLRRVRAVREAIGERLLMVDANHAYSRYDAVRVGRELQDLDVFWFEEPVVPEDLDGYRHVAQHVSVPIAAGECEYTHYGFYDLLRTGAISFAQPDICCAGGFTAVQKIAAVAEVCGVRLMPHVWGSGIAMAAGLQLLAALPPFPVTADPKAANAEPMLEYDRNPNPLRDGLLEEPIAVQDGLASISQRPGLGVHVDRAALKSFSSG